MKEPIEELFKQSLEGHEMPYNPDAWKAMSARLDVVSPVAGPNSYLKYYLGAAGIGVAAVATYFIFAGVNPSESTSSALAKETQTEQTDAQSGTNAKDKKQTNTTTSNGDAQTSNSAVIPAPTETPTSPEKGLQTSTTKGTSNVDPKTNKVIPSKTADTPLTHQKQDGGTANDPNKTVNSPVNTDLNTVVIQKMIMPDVADLCLNEEITITNPNGKEIYILDALNNTVKVIPSKKSVVFKPTVVGNYSLGYKNDAKIQSASNFRVNRIPDADFTIDLVNKFENGIPSTHVQAIGGQGAYIWNAEKQSADGVEADMHFYKKGEQTIELTVNNGQCSSTVEKTIFIENDYNLMAVTGFTPTGPEPKTNTFIPFALTQRDVRFKFMIIDGRDGGIVYETSDASLPWDGTDIRSGRRSETPQVYVWKAVILNPGKNEPSEYRGTITMY